MDNIVQIYIKLLGEKLEVWRPVEALKMGNDTYKIISPNPEPKIEKWQFKRGDLVQCEDKVFSDGTKGVIAVKKII
jgi:hypothetical protein